jgi:hypothetical protein
MIDPKQIPGYGIDADPARRPGVPKERVLSPSPDVIPPPMQESEIRPLVHPRRGNALPPVFGTAQPPKGLAGAIRRYAYKYPDHWMRHWSTLLFADRVDVWEYRARRMRGLISVLALATGGLLVSAYLQRRRTSSLAFPFEPTDEESRGFAELYLDIAPSS